MYYIIFFRSDGSIDSTTGDAYPADPKVLSKLAVQFEPGKTKQIHLDICVYCMYNQLASMRHVRTAMYRGCYTSNVISKISPFNFFIHITSEMLLVARHIV